MGFWFIYVSFAAIFVLIKCSSLNRPVEIDLIDSQLQLFENVVMFSGAMSEDVDHFRERIASRKATSGEISTNLTVEGKLNAFKQNMNKLLAKNNIFLKKLFTAAFPDSTEEGAEQQIKLGKNLLTHSVEIKRLFSHHINNEGMELWKELGLNLERKNAIDMSVDKKLLSLNDTQEMRTT